MIGHTFSSEEVLSAKDPGETHAMRQERLLKKNLRWFTFNGAHISATFNSATAFRRRQSPHLQKSARWNTSP